MYLAKALLTCALLFAATALRAEDFGERFAFVAIDEQTEKQFGPMPLDRRIIGRAVDACRAAEAKGVVLKFYYDQPKEAGADAALAAAISKFPVALQARISQDDGTEDEVPRRFAIGGAVACDIQGSRGWIPIPLLLNSAAHVGFVDYKLPEEVPMAIEYRGNRYKSLTLICLEMAYGTTASFEDGGRIILGDRQLFALRQNSMRVQFNEGEGVPAASLLDLLAGKLNDSVKGRVVIIGIETPKAPAINVFGRSYGVHRYFIEALASAQRSMTSFP